MKKILTSYQSNWLILFAVVSVTLMAFLGTTLYNTKGEPREAIVAVTMLQQGEWLLPINYGVDIPYKPPMLAWLIAAVSWVFNSGVVTEFTSRVPSAIACVAMVMMGYSVFSRGRRSSALPMAMALVTFTAFEMERAATSCRVDMVLTAFLVCAIYFFYLYYDRRRWGYLIGAVAMMALATLTKGPVGIILPCLIIWAWRLIRGDRFWAATGLMALCGAVALAPYAWWFAEAMARGGEEFTRLMIEENFGRFTGTMSYSSHSNPWWYYFPMLAAGFLPYTLLALFGLFVIRWQKPDLSKGWRVRFALWLRSLEPIDLLSLLAIVITLAFYMIPDSKRGVYILPLYPFLSWFMAKYMRRLCQGKGRAVRAYGWLIASLTVIVPLLIAVIMLEWIPQASGPLRGMAEVIYDAELQWWQLALIMISVGAAIATMAECQQSKPRQALGMTLITTVLLYWAVMGVYSPMVLNAKCLKASTESLMQSFPGEKHFYSMSDRLYEVNYYMDNRMRLIEKERPSTGIVVGYADRLPAMRDSLPQYHFDLVWLQSDQLVEALHKTPMAAWRFYNTDSLLVNHTIKEPPAE